MRIAVRLFHNLPEAGTGDVVHIHTDALNPAHAVIQSLTRLQAEGVDLAALTRIALVAKAYPADQYLLADPTMIGRPANSDAHQEAAPCVA